MSDAERLFALDRLVSIDPGRSATALRNVPHTLEVFDTHFPRFPVLPGVLVLGSMGRLAARVLTEDGRRWRLAGAEKIRYRQFIQPGDQMEITVEVKERGDESAVLSGTVKVDGKAVTTARVLHMVPAAEGTQRT